MVNFALLLGTWITVFEIKRLVFPLLSPANVPSSLGETEPSLCSVVPSTPVTNEYGLRLHLYSSLWKPNIWQPLI